MKMLSKSHRRDVELAGENKNPGYLKTNTLSFTSISYSVHRTNLHFVWLKDSFTHQKINYRVLKC